MPKLIYYAHACVSVEEGGRRIIIDPFLTGNPLAKAKPDQINVEAVLLSHGHGDHLGDAIDIAKRCKAAVIAPYELAVYCERRGATIHPMHIGGSFKFPFGTVKLTIAHHGSAVIGETTEYTGNPCGFLVTMGGKTLYHPGDTGLFYDMKLIGEMNRISVALLPIGDNFTMGIDDAVKATEFLKPEIVIPMHYNTLDVIRQDPKEFEAKAKKFAKVVILEPGGELSY